MKIKQVTFAKGNSAFYFDDQRAIKAGAKHDGFVYVGEPVTQKFTRIRQAGQSIAIILMLEDGQIATGDCAAVQYSGAGGRDPLFLASEFIPFLEKHIKPMLEGMEIGTFTSQEIRRHAHEGPHHHDKRDLSGAETHLLFQDQGHHRPYHGAHVGDYVAEEQHVVLAAQSLILIKKFHCNNSLYKRFRNRPGHAKTPK